MIAAPKPRWYRLTPDRLIIGLLLVECLLRLSGRYQWFGFNQDTGLPFLIGMAAVGATILLMLLWFAVALLFHRHFQFSIRSLLILMLTAAIPLSWVAARLYQFQQHRHTLERIEDLLVELEGRYPDGVPPKHWDNALAWTWNAKANCLQVPDFMFDENDSQKQFVRFADELEQRAKGQGGPETIAWIWDEIERLSKIGKTYSDKWRPVHGGKLDGQDGEMPTSQYPYVALVDSSVFHKRDCPLVSKLPWRQLTTHYSTREAAIGGGKSPCTTCNP
jgi:type III secretory pathway component EscS